MSEIPEEVESISYADIITKFEQQYNSLTENKDEPDILDCLNLASREEKLGFVVFFIELLNINIKAQKKYIKKLSKQINKLDFQRIISIFRTPYMNEAYLNITDDMNQLVNHTIEEIDALRSIRAKLQNCYMHKNLGDLNLTLKAYATYYQFNDLKDDRMDEIIAKFIAEFSGINFRSNSGSKDEYNTAKIKLLEKISVMADNN